MACSLGEDDDEVGAGSLLGGGDTDSQLQDGDGASASGRFASRRRFCEAPDFPVDVFVEVVGRI